MALLRTPMVLVGLLLVLIGLGNTYTGFSKTAEYEQLLAAYSSSEAQPVDGSVREDAGAWRSPLLSRVEIEKTPSDAARSKLDFYRVVYTGGRLLLLAGMFCAVAGAVHFWYRQSRAQAAT
jgi:hypothetical protein